MAVPGVISPVEVAQEAATSEALAAEASAEAVQAESGNIQDIINTKSSDRSFLYL